MYSLSHLSPLSPTSLLFWLEEGACAAEVGGSGGFHRSVVGFSFASTPLLFWLLTVAPIAAIHVASPSQQHPFSAVVPTEDPLVSKLRTQLGVIHPLPAPPPLPAVSRSVLGLFALFFFVGAAFDKLLTLLRRRHAEREVRVNGTWSQVPTSGFSLFFEEKNLQRKESVEWVNMVLGKLWKVYRPDIENRIAGLLQPVVVNLQTMRNFNFVHVSEEDFVEGMAMYERAFGDMAPEIQHSRLRHLGGEQRHPWLVPERSPGAMGGGGGDLDHAHMVFVLMPRGSLGVIWGQASGEHLYDVCRPDTSQIPPQSFNPDMNWGVRVEML